jgi:hypothetical protein
MNVSWWPAFTRECGVDGCNYTSFDHSNLLRHREKCEVYEGEYLMGKRHGVGTLTCIYFKYINAFKNQHKLKLSFLPFYTLSFRYEGTFFKNVMHGKGIYTFREGDEVIWYVLNWNRTNPNVSIWLLSLSDMKEISLTESRMVTASCDSTAMKS